LKPKSQGHKELAELPLGRVACCKEGKGGALRVAPPKTWPRGGERETLLAGKGGACQIGIKQR